MLFGALFFAAVPAFAFAYYNGGSSLDVYVQVQNQNGNCVCSNNYNGYNYANCCNGNNYYNGSWGNYSPSDFTVSVSGNSVSPQTFRGNANGTYVSLAPGYYSVNPQSMSGWAYSTSGNCSGSIGAGQPLSCTVTYSPTNGSYQNCNQFNSNCYPYQNCSYNNSYNTNCYPYQNCNGYTNGYCNNYPYQNAELTCYPAAQTAGLGAMAVFSATGGTGSYIWSSNGHIYSGNGATLSAQFYNPGPQTVEVESDGQTAYCSINVVGNVYPVSTIYPTTPYVTVTPALPNTGFAPNGWIAYALAALLFALAGVLAYPYVRNALAYIRG